MEIKGMSLDQFKEAVEFVQNHHAFAKWKKDEERAKEVELYPYLPEYGYNIKYVDCCYDSRFGDIWTVKFRGFNELIFSTNSFVGAPEPKNFPFTSLFEWVMAYLKGDWNDEAVLEQCTNKN